MILAKNILFYYDKAARIPFPDIALEGGEELLVLGKSGSGKTTVLNILGGLLRPFEGTVEIDETAIYDLRGAALDKFRGANIGMVFQKPHILAPLTVKENLRLAQYFSGKPDHGLIDRLLQDLGISHKAASKVTALSEGEAQRVSIARALVNNPKVVLADEPTASLDDENAEMVIHLLKEQAKKMHSALIIVTHDHRVKEHVSNQIMMGGNQ
ncbi:ABC transporter ATP-binding protein [Echinicola strongylocentroti]|uniref:ABC transporter ATP-binding protein n=1 Tax=Echinicola strongylocentroti TaxID=1795355 RepID=A0A2Z4IGI2_9BACT|nr:ATP-binding cassette domain-containing protein [Echinicola strongylocentroti]AWW29819.1 ABC transporter ATP-binding protein [Echinicola strongylocentroti]